VLGDWDDHSTAPASTSTPSIKQAENLIRQYLSLGLEGFLDYAYGHAALMYNSVGSVRGARKYAKLAAESARLKYGPESADVGVWRALEADVMGHWSWMVRRRRERVA
jgi:hypothetical protein